MASGFESLEAFQESHSRHQTSVREIHQRIFYRQTLDRMHETGLVSELLPDHLGQLGFADPDRAAATVERLTENLGRRANVMQQVLVIMVEALATTPDPDLGLVRLAWLLDGSFPGQHHPSSAARLSHRHQRHCPLCWVPAGWPPAGCATIRSSPAR